MRSLILLASAGLMLGPVIPAAAADQAPPPEQAAFASNLDICDVPTAATLYGRMFHLNFRMFREGGILAKAAASFNNSLMIGLSIMGENVIGSGKIRFDDEPVRAMAKVKFLKNDRNRISAALGYDNQYYDITRQKGLYGVVTHDTSASGFYASVHGGAGMVKLKNFRAKDHTNLFLGATGNLTDELIIGAEYDDMLYNHGSFNTMIGYSWDVGLRLDLGFKNLFRGVGAHHRILKILYTF